jgi:hypothetical protein
MNSTTREARRPSLFWRKVEKTPGCWIWRGATNSSKHPQFRVYQGTVSAQWYALRLDGQNIPRGAPVARMCGNRLCVRPDHCAVGADECARLSRINATRRQPRKQGKKLTGRVVEVIKSRIRAGELYREIATDYGIGVAMVCHIASGRAWGWVS